MSPSATVTPGALDVRGLTCLRGEKTVLRDLSFHLAAGEGLIVRGANGAGKSTLLRTLAGLLTPASGVVVLNGREMSEDLTAYLQHVAYLGHLEGLKPTETPIEAVRFRAALHGNTLRGTGQQSGIRSFTLTRPALPVDLSLDEGAAQYLHSMDLLTFAHTPIRALSAGQKRRVALAAMMAANAALWLVDEPTSSLDTAASTLFAQALERHLNQGGLAVITTHDRQDWPQRCRDMTMGAGS